MNQRNHTIEPEELMAYLDGELSPERAAATASHLSQCTECQARAAEFAEISKGLLEWEAEAGNLTLPGVITQALDEREHKSAQSKRMVQSVILSVWTWLKDPKSLQRHGWQLAGVTVAAMLVITIGVPNLLRNHATSPKFLSSEQARHAEQLSQYVDGVISTRTRNFYNGSATSKSLPPPPIPMATPGQDDSVGARSAGKLLTELESEDVLSNGPMIVRSAQLTVTIKEFDLARKGVDDILKRCHGYIGDLTVNTPNGAARSINAKLRIPSTQLDSALSALKTLGRVEAEAQNGEEVTQQYVDLNARLSNARKTQQRLIEIQRDRTGKLSDVLSVELQISRVQGEIEQMEAQLKTMKNQVSFASLDLTITEQYKAELKVVPPSLGDQLRNAGIDGIRSIRDAVISVLFWLLSTGPILLFWTLILFYPARIVWKKLRPRFVPSV
jgi:hypothetical protein